MPVDAAHAALLGAVIAAIGAVFGAILTAVVSRKSQYAQQLYAHRIELYRATYGEIDRFRNRTELFVIDAEKINVGMRLFAPTPVAVAYTLILEASARAKATRLACSGPVLLLRDEQIAELEAADREMRLRIQELASHVAFDSRSVPTSRLIRTVRMMLRVRRSHVLRGYLRLLRERPSIDGLHANSAPGAYVSPPSAGRTARRAGRPADQTRS